MNYLLEKLIFLLFFLHNLILLCQKILKLNSTHYSIMKIPNKRELQQIPNNHSSETDFKDFTNLYKKYTAKPVFFSC